MAAPIRQQDSRFPHNFPRNIHPPRPRIISEPGRYRPPNFYVHQEPRGMAPNFRQQNSMRVEENNIKSESAEFSKPPHNNVFVDPQSFQSAEPCSTDNIKPMHAINQPRGNRPPFTSPPPFHGQISGPEKSSFQNRTFTTPNRFQRPPPPIDPAVLPVSNQNMYDSNVRQTTPSAIQRFPFPISNSQPPPVLTEHPTFVKPLEQPMHLPPPLIDVPGFPQKSNEEKLVATRIANREALVNQRKQDHAWLESWMNDKKNISKDHEDVKTVASMGISEAHRKTQHMILLMARLQKNKAILESMEQEDKLIWDQKVMEVSHMKEELEALHREVTDPGVVADLKFKVQQRRKKRERMKRHRQAEYQAHQQEQAARNQLHKEIDAQQEKMAAKQLEEKQEADMKKDGDSTLAQVKKKMGDNSKMAQVISALRKLRQLRKDRQERQGLHWSTTSHDHVFENLCQSWTDRLDKHTVTYQAEEGAIKVILETEHEETREKEREIARRKEEERQRREEKKVQEMLFGNQKEPLPDDPLYPFSQFYAAASHSLPALISIRHEWDRHRASETTTGASCIPHTCVLPPDPSSDQWAKYLQT